MTDRWRPNAEDDRGRTPSPDDHRQSRATPRREERTHGPDGGLDSGRGFGRIGVPRSAPGRANAGRQTTRGAKPWTYSRREDFAGRRQKRRAEDLAESVSGVKDVINALPDCRWCKVGSIITLVGSQNTGGPHDIAR